MPVPTAEQIETFETAPSRIAAVIEGLSEERMHAIPAIGEWSIHEIIIHLTDSEAVGYWRIRKTLAERGATLAVYDEEAWTRNLSYRIQDRELALQLFSVLRASTAALLRLLPAEAWERTSVHAERGELSVYDLFMTYLEHGAIHLQQIERLKQGYK